MTPQITPNSGTDSQLLTWTSTPSSLGEEILVRLSWKICPQDAAQVQSAKAGCKYSALLVGLCGARNTAFSSE